MNFVCFFYIRISDLIYYFYPDFELFFNVIYKVLIDFYELYILFYDKTYAFFKRNFPQISQQYKN